MTVKRSPSLHHGSWLHCFHRKPSAKVLSDILTDMQDSGLFADLSESETHQLIIDSYPVLPAALHILPLISSRIAQNERTLFSFLFSLPAETMVTPAEVFDYFSDLMRGYYPRWDLPPLVGDSKCPHKGRECRTRTSHQNTQPLLLGAERRTKPSQQRNFGIAR